MNIELITPPTEEPITLAEAKEHLRVVHSDEDALIESLIIAARETVESKLERVLITQTWKHYFDRFPGEYAYELQAGIQSIASVTYRDLDNVEQTLAPTVYEISKDAVSQFRLAYGQQFPEALERDDSVAISVVAGYGDRYAVPEGIKQAIKLLVGHYYENREAVVVGTTTSVVPMAVDLLLRRYKVLYI